MLEIDWESEESHAFVNPRLPEMEREKLGQLKQTLASHIFLTTSGSHALKWVALSKTAFLVSAEAVNRHINAHPSDIWINALPHYHVGGLSIYARAFLGKTFVYRYDYKWNPKEWADYVEEKRGTLTSLVPTQLYDLVKQGIKPPDRLRILFIGGQHLSLELYQKAKNLGWPLIPTFGMTEMCSQVASASLDSPELKLLPHLEAKVTEGGFLALRSPSLFSGYLIPDFYDPKVDGWFETEDRVEIRETTLIPLGRKGDILKIKGEFVNLYEVERRLDALKISLNITAETALIPFADERSGHRLHLFHTPYNIGPLLELYNSRVAPYSQILSSSEVEALPKTELGKISKQTLKDLFFSR